MGVFSVSKSKVSLDSIKNVVSSVANKYKDIKKVVIFGSYAKGTANEHSDIDLIVDLEYEFDEDAYWELLETLETEFNCGVDLLTSDGVESSIIKDSILEGSRILYDRPQL